MFITNDQLESIRKDIALVAEARQYEEDSKTRGYNRTSLLLPMPTDKEVIEWMLARQARCTLDKEESQEQGHDIYQLTYTVEAKGYRQTRVGNSAQDIVHAVMDEEYRREVDEASERVLYLHSATLLEIYEGTLGVLGEGERERDKVLGR